MSSHFDVFGVGNAIVDRIAFIEDSFLEELPFPLPRGLMTLSDPEKQALLLQELERSPIKMSLCSGGSAANTIWTLMLCGAKTCYSAKVANDSHGSFYLSEFEKFKISFPVSPLDSSQGPTGTCIVLTTPDAERTMSTHLGLSTELGADDISLELLQSARYVYCEAYLWTGEKTREACLKAFKEAHRAKIPAVLSCSDPFVVKEYRSELEKLIQEYCDIVFCNLEEARALVGIEEKEDPQKDLEACLEYFRKKNKTAFITQGKEGCVVCHKHKSEAVPALRVNAIDSNGAGDAFAGGALFGLLQGSSPFEAAPWANYLASQVVSIPGARLETGNKYGQKYEEMRKEAL